MAQRWMIWQHIVIAVALIGVLAQFPVDAMEAIPKAGGSLVFAVDAEPSNYDCHANVSFAFLHPVAPHYSTLLKFDTGNYPQVTGDLAQSWTVSSDKLTYTFTLRPNVVFHDGSPFTSADVKASYERIIHPPPGMISPRQVDYAAVAGIDTPGPLTIVFRLQWPEAVMLSNFASPWNCIYSAARLSEDPLFPKTHVLGTGPFVFVEHVKGQHWTGKRWNRYFLPGRPYLDKYEADFMNGAAVVKGIIDGRIMAGFRSFTPIERDELVTTMGNRVVVHESPWLINLLLVFNTRQAPFDDVRVRRALSLAIDRWDMADSLASTTFLKFVGGLMRPGSAFSTSEAGLVQLPGLSRDQVAARAEARRLLAEAGQEGLTFTLTNRDVPMPYSAGADAAIAAWREIGVTVIQKKFNTADWTAALDSGRFSAALDFSGDYFDDPTLQLAKYLSPDFSPANHSGSTDRDLDALYIGQAITADPRKRASIVREFERRAFDQAASVPILWWNRIVVTSANLRGWNMTPSHYLGQSLTEVWIDR